MSYVRGNFHAAVVTLAGNGNIKQRLTEAYLSHLVDVDEAELPDSLQKRFRELRRRLSRVKPLNGESCVCASIRKMSRPEASQCACSIVEIFAAVASDKDAGTAMHPVDSVAEASDDQASVPQFLVKNK